MKLLIYFSLFVSFSSMANDIALKTGQYKSTTKFWVNGKAYDPVADFQSQMASNPEMKKMMDQMPAKDREQMMKSMKESAANNSNNTVEHCIKTKDLSAEKIIKRIDDSEDCKHVITKKSSTEVIGTLSCENGNKGSTVFKALGTEKYSFEFNGTFHGRAETKFVSEGTFISSTCKK